MKKFGKLLVLIMSVAVLSCTCKSCSKDTTEDASHKVAVNIDILAPIDNGLSVKSNSQNPQTVERNTTPACVQSIKFTVTSLEGMSEETKTINFTNDWMYDGNSDHTNDGTVPVTTTPNITMDMWTGLNNIYAETTSFDETAYTDPRGTEADGVSSGNINNLDTFTKAHVCGLSESWITSLLHAVFGSTQNTYALPINVKETATYLRQFPPYAVFTGNVPGYLVTNPIGANAKLDMSSNNSRMIYTFRFDTGVTGYDAIVSFPRTDEFNDPITDQECPDVKFGEDNLGWYSWTGANAVDGTTCTPIIEIVRAADNNQILRTINMVDLMQKHLEDGRKVSTLVGGMDIWNNVTITAEGVCVSGNGFDITYNWGEIDNDINID